MPRGAKAALEAAEGERDNRIVSPARNPGEAVMETSLRPRVLGEFAGQPELKENLSIFIEAARARGEPLDHVLLYGPPGLGKTTLAYVIGNELGVGVRATSGPAIERPGDLAAILTNLGQRDVLFIDEIHRLPRTVEEILYPAMEDFALDIVIGKGPSARTLRLDLPHFTLIGATTRAGLLTSPLRDRFGIVHRLGFYAPAELEQIVARSAGILGIEADADGVVEIARRARGTPRVANRLLKRVRDYAQVRADGLVTRPVACDALRRFQVDELGLDEVDIKILWTIADKFDGGPVGLETIAAAVSEEPETIEDICEPFLLQIGFLQRTLRGRLATRLAIEHLAAKGLVAQGKKRPGQQERQSETRLGGM